MKLLPLRALYAVAMAAGLAASAAGQTTSPELPVQKQPAPQPPQSKGKGQVIFSRSIDENGQTTTQAGPAAQAGGQMVNAPVASDAERQAANFTDFDMDVRLRPAE